MPFDPNVPATNAELTSVMFRDQFQGLKALIDAIQTLTAAQVDSTSNLPSGSPAQVTVSAVGNTLHFSFQIPEGPQGAAGAPGEVTAAGLASELNNAIGLALQSTSSNSNAVGQMSLSVDSNYNPTQMQQISDKLDELILALRR